MKMLCELKQSACSASWCIFTKVPPLKVPDLLKKKVVPSEQGLSGGEFFTRSVRPWSLQSKRTENNPKVPGESSHARNAAKNVQVSCFCYFNLQQKLSDQRQKRIKQCILLQHITSLLSSYGLLLCVNCDLLHMYFACHGHYFYYLICYIIKFHLHLLIKLVPHYIHSPFLTFY